MRRNMLLLLAVVVVAAQSIDAQDANSRVANAMREPQNWLTYSGTYDSQRYSLLSRITPANAQDPETKCVFESVGVNPQRMIIGHLNDLQQPTAETLIGLGKRGTYIAFAPKNV
jgi:glucose dehydrogenase